MLEPTIFTSGGSDMTNTTPATRTVAQMIEEARRAVEHLTPEQVAAEMAGSDAVLVDLRDSRERADNGAIGGSVHAARGMLEFYADPASAYHRPELDPSRRTILYCASGGRSALAAQTLQQLGYSNVAHLDGGVKGWIAAGRPVER
jgi:rhodanese-related sulfurtransferase